MIIKIKEKLGLISCVLCIGIIVYILILHNFYLPAFKSPIKPIIVNKITSQPALIDQEEGFKEAVNFVLQNEGGYSHNQFDRGGATAFGIDTSNNPEINASKLTKEDAIEIYREKYWNGTQIPFIQDNNIRIKFFDASVNMGYMQATKLLQRALNCTGTESIVDGVFGKKTLKNVNDCKNPMGLQFAFIAYLTNFYESLAEKDASQKVFLIGWLNRAHDVVGD